MSLLKNRRVAALILAVVILVMTPVGIVKTLGRLSRDVEELFFEGVELEGYTSASLQSHLDNKVKAALGLVTIGSEAGLDDLTEALRQARNDLMGAKTIEDKYEADRALDEAWRPLYDAIMDSADSGLRADAEAYAGTLQDIAGAMRLNPYNDEVEKFYEETAGRFPASLLVGLVSGGGPDYFGEVK